MKGDDYMRGRHFWVHFWCGLIVGGIIGVRICWGQFYSPWAFFAWTAVIALALALAVAYCGDPLWRWFLND
jgi:hypothetical protein